MPLIVYHTTGAILKYECFQLKAWSEEILMSICPITPFKNSSTLPLILIISSVAEGWVILLLEAAQTENNIIIISIIVCTASVHEHNTG